MKLSVVASVLSLCFMVSMAYPEPYYGMQQRPQADAQEMSAAVAADYPHMPFDAEIAQISVTR